MKVRAGTGWAYVMTDLSLILFMITAAALSEAPPGRAVPAMAPAAMPALGEPVAVWRGTSPAELQHWLAASASDPRLRLTVVGTTGESAAALALAQGAGRPARVLLEPGQDAAPFAALTYDQPLAQPLQSWSSPPAVAGQRSTDR